MAPRLRWELIRTVGEGAFGEVHEARCAVTGARVAVKLCRLSGVPGAERDDGESLPKGALRELWALQALVGAPHVSQYVAHFPRGTSLAIVLRFCPSDLRSVVDELPEGERLDPTVVKAWSRHLLVALAHVHALGLMHRDLKPSNLLLDELGALQLADFGQARPIAPARADGARADYTHQVSTRWYRAPEILFGARAYDERLDMWGFAVVFGELLEKRVLFAGNSDIEQLLAVFKTMGSPSAARWPGAASLPDFCKITFPEMPPSPLRQVAPSASESALGLLSHTLVLESSWRYTAREALADAYFETEPSEAAPERLAALVSRTREIVDARPRRQSPRPTSDDSW